jgi:CDP-diacylglycerol---glycerol-3-phosphate 3-phosphatidyltransferase
VTHLVPDPAGTPPQTARLMNLANAVTMARVLLVPLFALALVHGGPDSDLWRLIAWAIFAVASVTDRIDGQIARKRGLVTEFGKLADPIADKTLTGTALVLLSVEDLLPWWVTAVILVREIGVTLLRFWVIRHGVIPASRGGKLKTLLQAVAIGLYVLPLPHWLSWLAITAMAAALVLTVGTGVDYVLRAVRLRRTGLRARAAAVAARPQGTAATPQGTAASQGVAHVPPGVAHAPPGVAHAAPAAHAPQGTAHALQGTVHAPPGAAVNQPSAPPEGAAPTAAALDGAAGEEKPVLPPRPAPDDRPVARP